MKTVVACSDKLIVFFGVKKNESKENNDQDEKKRCTYSGRMQNFKVVC